MVPELFHSYISQERNNQGPRQSQVDPWPVTFLPVRAFNACYLQISLPFASRPPSPRLKVPFYTRTCSLSDCFLPHRAIFNQRDTNSVVWDRYKIYFLNTQNWFLQAIFHISCRHLNATKAFSMSKQCHLENPFTLSLPAVVLHPFLSTF